MPVKWYFIDEKGHPSKRYPEYIRGYSRLPLVKQESGTSFEMECLTNGRREPNE